jgi:hypothetical protein
MIIIGVDFHPEFQQIVSVDIDTGELQEKRLEHPEAAEKFYRAVIVKMVADLFSQRLPIDMPKGMILNRTAEL